MIRIATLPPNYPKMKKTTHSIILSLLLIATPVFATVSNAATPGSDLADQSAYKDGWSSGSNGGTGFKGWNLISSTTTGACGFFIGDSKNVGGGSGADINVNGKSFGMFGKGKDNSAEAYRSLDSGLKVGQTVFFDIVVNFRNGLKGVDLRNAGDEKTIFNLNIGADDYVVNNAATGNGSIGNEYSQNTIFTFSFTQTSDTGGTWKVTRKGGVSKTVSGTYTGVAESFKFYVRDTDDGSENDLYINNLTVTH